MRRQLLIWGQRAGACPVALSPMNPEEYSNLARVEKDHWYYVGKRELVRTWIARCHSEGRRLRVLDCGAGTGCFADEMALHHDVHVLDDHEESLRILRAKFPAGNVHSLGEGGRLPFQDGAFDVVTALDVLEHIEHDAAALSEMGRILRPGGLLVATVPASMKLWSDWDVSLHHFRRYDRNSFASLFEDRRSWEPVWLNYTNFLIFPVAWIVRRCAVFRSGRRSEDTLPPRWINQALRWVFVRQGLCRLRVPFGVSLICIARKPQSGV